jgi:hypothetical protein
MQEQGGSIVLQSTSDQTLTQAHKTKPSSLEIFYSNSTYLHITIITRPIMLFPSFAIPIATVLALLQNSIVHRCPFRIEILQHCTAISCIRVSVVQRCYLNDDPRIRYCTRADIERGRSLALGKSPSLFFTYI